MNEVKFKANKKEVEALDQRVTALEEGGGGGNSPLIVNSTYNETDEMYHLDKTFGEIRTALNVGQTVLVFTTSFESQNIEIVEGYSYLIHIDPEYPEADGSVETKTRTYDVHCESAPYTLAALDALYPMGA